MRDRDHPAACRRGSWRSSPADAVAGWARRRPRRAAHGRVAPRLRRGAWGGRGRPRRAERRRRGGPRGGAGVSGARAAAGGCRGRCRGGSGRRGGGRDGGGWLAGGSDGVGKRDGEGPAGGSGPAPSTRRVRRPGRSVTSAMAARCVGTAHRSRMSARSRRVIGPSGGDIGTCRRARRVGAVPSRCRRTGRGARMAGVTGDHYFTRRARGRRPGRARSSSPSPGATTTLAVRRRGVLRRPARPGHRGAAAQGRLPAADATGTLLDLGCGYGPIACVLATSAPAGDRLRRRRQRSGPWS